METMSEQMVEAMIQVVATASEEIEEALPRMDESELRTAIQSIQQMYEDVEEMVAGYHRMIADPLMADCVPDMQQQLKLTTAIKETHEKTLGSALAELATRGA